MVRDQPSATLSSAASQLTCCKPSGPRTCGCSKRPSSETVSPRAEPLTHSLPKLAGWLLSPAIWMAPSGIGVADTPQPTPQYGQVVRTENGGEERFTMVSWNYTEAALPNSKRWRMAEISRRLCIKSKYQGPSATSPYNTAPARRLFSTTRRL